MSLQEKHGATERKTMSFASPIAMLRAATDELERERNYLLQLVCVLVQKLDNDVVVTNGELESLPLDTAIHKEDSVLGVRLTTRRRS